MTHALDPTMVFNAGAAVLYTLLGVWVLTLTPRRRQTTLLGGFAITFGLAFLATELVHLVLGLAATPSQAVANAVGSVASLLAVVLACSVPDPLEDRRLLAISAAVGGVFSTLVALSIHGSIPARMGSETVAAVGVVVGFGGLYAASLVLALRARPARGADGARVTQWALLSVAFAAIFGFLSGGDIRDVAAAVVAGSPGIALQEAGNFLGWFTVAGVWAWNMIAADDAAVRIHRNAALVILGMIAAGAVYFAAVPEAQGQDTVMRGVVHALGVGLLAYGVLRHDLAGLDAKVEWGVSRTTVAGVFVAVFFVVSEAAQVLFAGVVENELLGVVAAGALVFVLAPIQRAADELADAVVPGGDAAAGAEGPEARYRTAVEMALADGDIGRDEERNLRQLEEELDLSPTRALEIREQVEDEAAANAAATGGAD